MDELSRIWFRAECRDRLRDAQGTAFQDLFSDLMGLAFPKDFQRIRPYGNQGDQKCDGYLASSGTVFQVYAPRTIKQAQLIDKAREDFAGAVDHWRKGSGNDTQSRRRCRGSPPTKYAFDYCR